MNIIIAGAGNVGTHLAKLLRDEQHNITVIDDSEERLRAIEAAADVITECGSPTSFEALRRCEVNGAQLLIAVTPSEDTNIVACMLGKSLGAAQTVARIDHDEYLDVEHRRTFAALGVDNLFYPENIAAAEVVNLLTQTSTSEYVEFANGLLATMVFRVELGSPLAGKTLGEVVQGLHNPEFRFIAIHRNNRTIIPHLQDTFELGDWYYVMCTRSGAEPMLKFVGKENIDVNNLIILGGSRIGAKVTASLDRRMNIKIIEQNRERCAKLAAMFKNAMVINGDGRATDLLIEEGLQKTDAFVAVTGNSETNILACLLAKQMGVKRTIAEVENLDYIQLAESIGIDTTINKKLITAGQIFNLTQKNRSVQSVKYLAGSEAEMVEFLAKPGCKACRMEVKDLNFPRNATIGGIVRAGAGLIVWGSTKIREDDHVIVFTLDSEARSVGGFFG
ncbi:MAG: Trk system potassium transporter TrkA [Prevotellaceae bacterium]|jgi:trk system potassium uptake protein TrkA|nr:Trk system potassium transporter TrkA [Prevotellaceae bacterium]